MKFGSTLNEQPTVPFICIDNIITSETDKNIVLNSAAVCIELFRIGVISVMRSRLHRVQVQVVMNKSVKTKFRTTKPVQRR